MGVPMLFALTDGWATDWWSCASILFSFTNILFVATEDNATTSMRALHAACACGWQERWLRRVCRHAAVVQIQPEGRMRCSFLRVMSLSTMVFSLHQSGPR